MTVQSSTLVAVFGTVAAVSTMICVLQRSPRSTLSHGCDDDFFYLKKCHDLRLSLTKPRHSGFRVVALLLLRDGTTIFGANDEASGTIQGALCAERAALCRYRSLGVTIPIRCVYIVSDHPNQPIPPGCLCREYMYGHFAMDVHTTRIVLQSANRESRYVVWTLQELYPYPSFTARCHNTAEAKKLSQSQTNPLPQFRSLVSAMANRPLSEKNLDDLYHTALSCAQAHTCDDYVHPVRYAAAVAVAAKENKMKSACIEIKAAAQLAGLEYGCTQDAVCGALALTMNDNNRVVCVLQVDQWGNIHPPFAVARSILTEHYKNDTLADGPCWVVCSNTEVVPANLLVPGVPPDDFIFESNR